MNQKGSTIITLTTFILGIGLILFGLYTYANKQTQKTEAIEPDTNSTYKTQNESLPESEEKQSLEPKINEKEISSFLLDFDPYEGLISTPPKQQDVEIVTKVNGIKVRIFTENNSTNLYIKYENEENILDPISAKKPINDNLTYNGGWTFENIDIFDDKLLLVDHMSNETTGAGFSTTKYYYDLETRDFSKRIPTDLKNEKRMVFTGIKPEYLILATDTKIYYLEGGKEQFEVINRAPESTPSLIETYFGGISTPERSMILTKDYWLYFYYGQTPKTKDHQIARYNLKTKEYEPLIGTEAKPNVYMHYIDDENVVRIVTGCKLKEEQILCEKEYRF